MEWMGRTYTITEAEKRKVLGENLAEAHGFDLTDIERQQSNDEYADRDGVADPYPTTSFEVVGA